MNKNLKQLLNSLKCPICQCQIDTLLNANNPIYRGFQYCCVANHKHYAIKVYENYSAHIVEEIVHLYDQSHEYCILKTKFNTEIAISDLDLEGRVRFSFVIKKFRTELDLFDFQNFNVDKAINRIKTVLVFQ